MFSFSLLRLVHPPSQRSHVLVQTTLHWLGCLRPIPVLLSLVACGPFQYCCPWLLAAHSSTAVLTHTWSLCTHNYAYDVARRKGFIQSGWTQAETIHSDHKACHCTEHLSKLMKTKYGLTWTLYISHLTAHLSIDMKHFEKEERCSPIGVEPAEAFAHSTSKPSHINVVSRLFFW